MAHLSLELHTALQSLALNVTGLLMPKLLQLAHELRQTVDLTALCFVGAHRAHRVQGLQCACAIANAPQRLTQL